MGQPPLILLTGATGLIGQALGLELARRGHQIRVLARDMERARLWLPFPCEIHEWKDATAPVPSAALHGADGVIHLAGEPIAAQRWSESIKDRIRETRVTGTERLREAWLALPQQSRPKTLIQGSAIGIYGDRGDETLPETAEPGADRLLYIAIP